MLYKKKKGADSTAAACCCAQMADKYEPLRVLGHGSQGIVLLCKDKASAALVACKTSLSHYNMCIHRAPEPINHKPNSIKSKLNSLLQISSRKKASILKPHTDAQSQNDELRCEIDMLDRARGHPNILPVETSFKSEVDGSVHLVTPFCKHGSLLDKLLHDHRGMPSSESLRPLLDDHHSAEIIARVASALSHCHARGIVHRDVKLGNIFLHHREAADADDESENVDVFLGDFGTATIIPPTKKLSLLAGTKLYMAPEIKRGSYDHRVDVWSLGMVLHVLLTGTFLGHDMRLHPSIHDYQACDLLLGMFSIDPEKRLTMKQVLSHPWVVQNTCKLPLTSEKQNTRVSQMVYYSTKKDVHRQENIRYKQFGIRMLL